MSKNQKELLLVYINFEIKIGNISVCYRMVCPRYHEVGWNQTWCEFKNAAEGEWPPTLPTHGNGEDWTNMDVTEMVGSPMDIPLPLLDIEMVGEAIRQVEDKSHSGEETNSSVSWDLIQDVVQNGLNEEGLDQAEGEQKVELCVPNDGLRAGPSTPEGQCNEGTNIEKLWVSAKSLAEALARYAGEEVGEKDTKDISESENLNVNSSVPVETGDVRSAPSSQGVCHDCCHRGNCQTVVQDSPGSPEPEHVNREWRSDTSDDGQDQRGYQPEVSPVSSEPWRGVVKDPRQKHMGYWQKQRGAKSIAHVRPNTRELSHERRRTLFNRRRVVWPREFNMVVQAPVLQTSQIISRVIQSDGTVVEESLSHRFTLARTVATQTTPEDMVQVVEGNNGENGPGDNPEVDVVIDLTAEDSDHEEGEEDTDDEEREAIPAMEGAADSAGTSVQDEHDM
jgi:hypothetical protein